MSLRARLLVAMGTVVVLLLGAGVVIARSTERHLMEQVDAQLDRATSRSGVLLQEFVGGGRFGTDDLGPGGAPGDPNRSPGQLYIGFLGPRGDTLRTVALPDTTRTAASPPALGADRIRDEADRGPFTARATNGDLRYRVVVEPVRRFGVSLVVAMPLEGVDAAVQGLRVVEATVFAVTALMLALATFWVLRLGVKPLKEMTATAVAIGDGDLSRRIPDSAAGTEAAELGGALNHMLERIQAAFDERSRSESRLRQFVSDASHELRTPVTTIRGYAELYRKGGLADEGALGDAMRRTEAEAVRMGDLVEDLLALARLDERRPLRLGPVRLDVVIADATRDAAAVDDSRHYVLDGSGPVEVVADEQLVRQAVANLVTNARVHTPPGTTVRLSALTSVDEAVLTVADDGPGMDAEHAARAFERFYRADPSRDRHTGGSGLGLAIVAEVLAAHGGRADLSTEAGRGTTVRLHFPSPGAADAPRAGIPTVSENSVNRQAAHSELPGSDG